MAIVEQDACDFATLVEDFNGVERVRVRNDSPVIFLYM